MTLNKLAQLAHASVSTVSKAFSGKGDISDATREHIFAVAREHGCFQQFYHVPYDRPVVAVIIPEVIGKTYLRYLEALRRSLEENGYTMLLSISNFDPQMQEELIRYYFEHGKVDGLVLVDGSALGDGLSTAPENTRTALVRIGRSKPLDVCVHSGLRDAIADCLADLHSLGHRNVAYVGEPLTEQKRRILSEEMEKLGISVCREHMICSLKRFEEAGRDGVRKLLDSSLPFPTVIFGGYGTITAAILDELTAHGIRVPEDVSLISLNKDGLSESAHVQIAHLSCKIEDECKEVIRLLKERIGKEHPNEPCSIKIPTCLYPGNTIKPPRQKEE